ncbi:MAG TPA: glycosyltransferase family 4 protein [Archangium sp.]|nr:glycosyltransferase family 4 protein [Archangium sp.]
MSDLPRLLLCSFDVLPGPSGSSRRVTEYLKALPDRFSVVVLSVKTPDHSHIEKYQGARLLRVPVGAGDLASRIQSFERAVRRQLESEEYALVHFTDPFGGYALCELKGDYGYRLVYEAQGFPSQELRYTHPQLEGDRKFLSKVRRQELFCLMNADRVITGSPTTRSFIHSLGVGQESVQVVRAPVDLAPYSPEALGSPDGTPMRLMYLGSQVAWQGLAGLLRGLALAVREVDVRLTLVGARHPDWQPHLEDLVSALGLEEHVEFQPPVAHDDVAKVLALADVGVLPLDDVDRNRVQGGALSKVSEYLAAGRPVLATDLPMTRELIPSSAGVFSPPGDAQALADHLISLARDVPRRVSLGKQARAYAEQWLDAGLIRGQLLDIYDGLLGKSPVPMAPADESKLSPTMTGTPTNRVLALAGTVSASRPEAASPPPSEGASPSEPLPDTGPDQGGSEREELPRVTGHFLYEEGLDPRLIKTELEAARPDALPVIMGLPLREPSSTKDQDNAPTEQDVRPSGPPVIMGLPLREPPAPPASPPPIPARPSLVTRTVSTENRPAQAPAPAAAPEPAQARPPALPPRREERPQAEPPGLPSRPSISIPPLPPKARAPSGSRPAAPPVVLTPLEVPPSPAAQARTSVRTEEPEEISEAEAEEIHEVDSAPTPTDAQPLEEPEEISSAEIHEAETPETPPREPPESRLNPWFAQLAHGYCPPEGTQFARHTPPTTMPGRDEDPAPPPAPRAQGVSRGKPS